MIKLYGVAFSRAARCVWMLEELGVPYELDPVTDTHTAEFLAINPNGKVPALKDGSVVMWESLAINCWLARRYSSELSPRSLDEEAHVLKWSFWADAELECYFNHAPSLDAVTDGWRAKTLGILEKTLERSPHLIGQRFTVADLNVATMFLGPVSSRVDLNPLPLTKAWLAACRARPAAAKVHDMMRTAYAARPGA